MLTSPKNWVKIFRVEKIKTHGGSLRIYIQKKKNIKVDKSVNEILKEEEIYGIKNYNTYQKFGEKVYKIRDNVIKNINKLKKDGNKLIGYGAPAKATTALNFFGISNEIDCIIEDNKLKQGKIVPGVNIPIISKENIKEKPDYLIVLAWNFFKEIKRENRHLSKQIINIKDLEK